MLEVEEVPPEAMVGGKVYSAGWVREYWASLGIEPVIPHESNEAGRRGPFQRATYRRQNILERCLNSLKWFRRVATRYEKLALHYWGMIKLAILFRFLD